MAPLFIYFAKWMFPIMVWFNANQNNLHCVSHRWIFHVSISVILSGSNINAHSKYVHCVELPLAEMKCHQENTQVQSCSWIRIRISRTRTLRGVFSSDRQSIDHSFWNRLIHLYGERKWMLPSSTQIKCLRRARIPEETHRIHECIISLFFSFVRFFLLLVSL